MSACVWIVGGIQGGLGVSTTAALVAGTLEEKAGKGLVIGFDADRKEDMKRLWDGEIYPLDGDWEAVLDRATSGKNDDVSHVVVGLDRGIQAEQLSLDAFVEDATSCGVAVNLIVLVHPDSEERLPTLEVLKIPITVVIPNYLITTSRLLVTGYSSKRTDYQVLACPALPTPSRQALLRSKANICAFIRGGYGGMLHERIAIDIWHRETRDVIGQTLIGL